MRLNQTRSGFTLVGLLVILVVIALGGMVYLFFQVKELDNKGKALTAWIGKVDEPTHPNEPATVGLTTYIIHLKNHVSEHIGQKVTPAGPAHTGASDSHRDPPPPPGW